MTKTDMKAELSQSSPCDNNNNNNKRALVVRQYTKMSSSTV